MLIKQTGWSTLVLPMPVSSQFDFTDLESYIEEAEQRFIIPAIGQEQYDSLDAAYNNANPTLTPAQTKLLKACQKVILCFAFAEQNQGSSIVATPNGPRTPQTEDEPRPFKYQFNNSVRSLLRRGMEALEALLNMLELNPGDYPDWTGSDVYTKLTNSFVHSAKVFNTYFFINNSRFIFQRFIPILERVQQEEVKATLGEEFYNELLNDLNTNITSSFKKEIINLVRAALVHYAVEAGTKELALLFDDRGVSVFAEKDSSNATDNRENAPEKLRIVVGNLAKTNAENYIGKLRAYLYANASVVDLITYRNSSAYTPGTEPLHKIASIPGSFIGM